LSEIIFTKVDETPALASASLLPVTEFLFKQADAGIQIKEADVSFAGRILAAFSKGADDVASLGEGVRKNPDINILKLPNASAVAEQLITAIKELQNNGYDIPDYPEKPSTEEEKALKKKYDKILGSVVNPALRAGNSDRFIPEAVIDHARKKPHEMGEWSPDSKTRIAHMNAGDFRHTEKSSTIGNQAAGKKARIEFVAESGAVTVLKKDLSFEKGDIIDSAIMDRAMLRRFFDESMEEAKTGNLAVSLHLKATMMIKTDGVFFGDAVESYLRPVFDKHSDFLKDIGVDSKKGLSPLLAKLNESGEARAKTILKEIDDCVKERASLAMKKDKSHLDAPNLVLADVSQSEVARWAKVPVASGEMRDTLAIMPDSTYAPIYQAGVDFFKENGALDPRTMGHVRNIGLMADGAEEYGSKGTTFEALGRGIIRVVADDNGQDIIVNEQVVSEKDIWRMCKTNDAAVQNWAQVAIEKAEMTGLPTIFWLDETRPHDAELIKKIKPHLEEHPDIKIMKPEDAMRYTLEQVSNGQDVISVTGNVLRDYLTDYFPILGVGGSSQMLSQVPLLAGGLLGETGSGGTAPDIFDAFISENKITWSSLGEIFALEQALRFEESRNGNRQAGILANALQVASGKIVEDGRVDTRMQHVNLLLYVSQALAAQNDNLELKGRFSEIAAIVVRNKKKIEQEIQSTFGKGVDVGGRFYLDDKKVSQAMQPSSTFNEILARDFIAERAPKETILLSL
jgi:isocitrate dehydrogenase